MPVTSHRAQHIELAQRQKMEGQAATQRMQRTADQDHTEGQHSPPSIMHDELPSQTQSSRAPDTAGLPKPEQFEDPRSLAISRAAIAEIGERMAVQEQGWHQVCTRFLLSLNKPIAFKLHLRGHRAV